MLSSELRQPVLVETTSNQCNQFGGYTGMKPADFVRLVRKRADRLGMTPGLLHFGGDHLGPQPWKDEPAAQAMAKAREMIRAYVEAGISKIHLDCSEACAGDPPRIGDRISADRSAELAAVCEEHAPDAGSLAYVIGTEVPPPGGARVGERHDDNATHAPIEPTSAERARRTLENHRASFSAAGLHKAWSRVIGLVVQPGVEFSSCHVTPLPIARAHNLSRALEGYPGICFEAHSTDFQTDNALTELARRNFAILKVGPALTFAYRRAIYALDHVREWQNPDHGHDRIAPVMERLMRNDPRHWKAHYEASDGCIRRQLHFGYSDRIRYYWPQPEAVQAVATLYRDLDGEPLSRSLLDQYFSADVIARAEAISGKDTSLVRALVLAQIQAALRPYFFTTGR